MSLSDEELLYGELIDNVDDDKLLCDLHLNSALNLDQLRFEMNGSSQYNMITNSKVKRSLSDCKNALYEITSRDSRFKSLQLNTDPGMIPIKVELSSVDGEQICLEDNTVSRILLHLDTGMRGRGYHSRFKRLSNVVNNSQIKLPKTLFANFNCIMSLCLCISEKLRGGAKPVSIGGGIIDHNNFLYTSLISENGQQVWIGTDGTTVIAWTQRRGYLTVWEDLLALMDTIGQRVCTIICHQLGRTILEPGSIELDQHRTIIRKFDEMLTDLQNPGYKFVGMFETLCVSVLLMKAPDGINDPIGLLGNMMSELNEISTDCNIDFCKITNMFNNLVELIGSLDECQVSNLFCEYRIWGHPYVDVKSGMEKVHKIGTKEKNITPFYPKYMVRHFKESVITGLYKRDGKYPNIIRDNLSGYNGGSYLLECVRDNQPIERYRSQYIIEDFDMIEMREVFKIPSTYDLTHVLNDKAISPKLSELVKAVSDGLSLERMQGRRGILAWLQGTTMNCRAFLKSIGEKGLDSEDLVIGMYEKEREMKVEARMFALMSETMRYYFVITEGLIADFLLPLFPQITMKDSLNKLQKKFWTAGAGKDRGKYDTNINIDFSKWNTNMRGTLMTPLFEEMDKLFGLKAVISRTHQIFQDSLIYSSSGKYFPRMVNGEIIEDGVMCYRGHLGGMEGLRQKGWTIGTVCLIDHVAKECAVRYKLMGQGDNQIIKLLMNETLWRQCDWSEDVMAKEARLKSDQFLKTLEDIFGQVGLPVKPRECWRSSNLFMYGKAMLLGGKVLSQWSKKILRSYALSNEGTLTVGGTIGTIASNCMSSCTTMENPQLGYACFLILGSWTLDFLLKYHPFSRCENICDLSGDLRIPHWKSRPHSKPVNNFLMKSVILLIPSIAGGSVTIPFTSYIVRGFPDPASEAYSWIKLLSEGCNLVLQRMAKNFFSYIVPKDIPLKQLSASPLSLNHVRVLSPVLSAKKESLAYVRRMYSDTNNVVKIDQEISSLYEQIDVENELITDPANPLLFSDLCSLFPHRISEDLLGRVSSTRTIKKLSLRSSESPIIKVLQDSEINFLLYLKWRAFESGTVYDDCATAHVREIRNIGWGREITGVTTPHPLEMTKICCYQGVACEETTDFIYILKDEQGGFSPYLGSTVRNKVKGNSDSEIRGEPLLKHIVKLATYANWMGLGTNHKKLLMELISLYGGQSAETIMMEILQTEGNFSGSVDHRYLSGMMSDGSFINYAAHIGSLIFMSSDSMVEYGRGNTNYTLQFQALYCWVQFVALLTAMTRSGHCHITCSRCVVPVSEGVVDIEYPSGIIVERTGILIQEMLGIDIERALAPIPTLNIVENESLKEIINFKLCGPDRIKQSCLRLSLTNLMALKISLGMMQECLEEPDTFEVGLADLQKFPRIYGKKLFLDELLKMTSRYLIILSCRRKKSGTHGRDLYRSKRYVIDRLAHLNSSQLAALGSLTLEKSVLHWKEYTGNRSDSACFPITISEHLHSTLSTLRKYVMNTAEISTDLLPSRLYLPFQDINDSELKLCIIAMEVMMLGSSWLMNWFSNQTENPRESNLREQYVIRHIKKRLIMCDCISDKMFKLLSTCSSIPIDRNIQKIPAVDTWGEIALRRGRRKSGNRILQPAHNFGNRDHREITLPTSSLYKWEEFSAIGEVAKNVLVLGDGTGTSSYILSLRFPGSVFYPMGLFENKDVTPQDLGAFTPPVSRGITNIRNSASLYIPDDINSIHFMSTLRRFIDNFSEPVTILSDIELGGGSILSHGVLHDLLQLDCHLILKGYLKEVMSNEILASCKFEQFNIMLCSLGNINYRECILEMTPGHIGYVDTEDIVVKYEEMLHDLDQEAIIERTRFISNSHPFLRQLSYNLAMRHLDSLGFFLNEEILLWDADQLLMYLYMFVNTHYLFSAERLPASSKRSITPDRRRKIERLFQIFFMITTPYGLDLTYVRTLKLVHNKNAGDKGLKHFKKQITFVYGHEVLLSKKDRQTAQTLGCLRLRNNLPIRPVRGYSPVMSDIIGECLGFVSNKSIKAELYLSSGTFDSGSRFMLEG